jgi:hypothetical protein
MVGLRGLDAWLTREPDYPEEAPQPRCEACGGFLRRSADRREPWEDTEPCDGQRTEVSYVYSDADREVLDIIGWEHIGSRYWVEYDPVCGLPEPHEPHDYVVAGGVIEYRTCRRCGAETREVIV